MLLTARNLTRTLPTRTLYSSLSLTLSEGEILTVRGPSGSGKTRLLRHLATLDPLDGADLRLEDRTPEEITFQRWRSEVLFVPHATPTLPGTPSEFASRLAALHIHRHGPPIPTPPDSWNLAPALFDQPWSQLSAGERQRVLLVLFLALDPKILLLDEPTATLDPEAVAAVEETLRKHTCIWVTHHPEQAERVGDRVLHLDA